MKHVLMLLLIIIINTSLCSGQNKFISDLEACSEITKNIKSDSSHLFRIDLPANTFLFAIVTQHGVDIKIDILDKKKQFLKQINHQNQLYGPEQLSFTSSEKASYYIRISTVSQSSAGSYTISIKKVQKAASEESGYIDELFSFYDRPDHPGASVYVLKDGKTVHAGSYGSANLANSRMIDQNTSFHIGSETKQFVAFAIASLINKGYLSRNDNIRKYLPEVPVFKDTIRIRHLINHTSGLREIYDDLSAIGGWRKGIKTIDAIRYHKDLNFMPGEQYSYCNTEYGLLQEIFERVRGKSLSDWLKDNVFDPLGMNNTFFCDNNKTVIRNFAVGYTIDQNGVFVQNKELPNGIISTGCDLSKWILYYDSHFNANEALFNNMFQSDTLNNGKQLTNISGQKIIDRNGIRFFGHGGGFEGYKSYILRCPEKDFGVVVLSNFDYFNNWFMTRKVANIYLGIDLTETETINAVPQEINISPDKASHYSGTYWFDHNLYIKISTKDSSIIARVSGQPEIEITPYNNGKFYFKDSKISIDFIKEQGDTISRITIFQNGEIYYADKLKPLDPGHQDLSIYLGRYYCSELETIYNINDFGDTFLMARHPVNGTIELKLFRDKLFTGDKWFFRYIEFIENNNKIAGFKLSTERVKNLWFEKI